MPPPRVDAARGALDPVAILRLVENGVGDDGAALGKDQFRQPGELTIDAFRYARPVGLVRQSRFGRNAVHGLADAVALDDPGAGRRADPGGERLGDRRLARAAQTADRDEPRRRFGQQGLRELEIGPRFGDQLRGVPAAFLDLRRGHVGAHRRPHRHEERQENEAVFVIGVTFFPILGAYYLTRGSEAVAGQGK